MSLAPAAYQQLLTAIDRLYEAALDSSKWKAFLETAAEMLRADNAYVSEIAHGLTEGSARQYLKRVFKKTATRRQADLIRVVGDALVQHS